MLVRESQILGESALDLLDRMAYLNESTYDPMCVQVRFNDRLEKDLIMLESFCEFADSNGIHDAGEAIAYICESNHISPNNIGFYVEETSCIADDNITEVAYLLMENGYGVYAAPISSSSVYYRELEEALALDEQCATWEDCVNLQAYCEENIFEKASNKVGDARDWVKERVSRNYKNAKETMSSGVDALSKKYAAAKQKVSELASQVRRAAGDAKAFLLQKLDKAKAVMKSIGDKLAAAKNKVVDTASSAKKRVFG